MKKIGYLFILSSIGILLVSSCSEEKKYSMVKLKTAEDTVSYYLGMYYGTGWKQSNIDSIFDYQAFNKGVSAAINNDSLPVTSYEIQTYLNAYFTKFQENQVSAQYKDYIDQNTAFLAENAKKDSVVTLPSGLQYKILTAGNGNKPTDMDMVKVNYTGSTIEDFVFDSSYDRGEPAEFMVNQVIAGWSEALKLMSKGSTWMLYIPADLAYGSQAPQGSGIKPFSTLIFKVELLDINTQTE
jgi:FKBP-type peptidyl-prolyl cis-trans isomerase FklB